MMKLCGNCKKEKELDLFSWRSKSKGTKNIWCKDCMREYDRKRHKSFNKEDRERKNKERRKRRIEARTWIISYLEDHPCVDCGETDFIVLQFDHIKGDKMKDVSTMVSQGYGLKKVQKEISKCVVRCANCHQRKTAKQLGWYDYMNEV